MVKKNKSALLLAELALCALYALFIILAGKILIIFIIISVIFIFLSTYLILYYRSLKYYISENRICAEKGIFFRRHQSLPVGNILWQVRIVPPFAREAMVTILKTCGGDVVIFGEADFFGTQ